MRKVVRGRIAVMTLRNGGDELQMTALKMECACRLSIVFFKVAEKIRVRVQQAEVKIVGGNI